MQNALGERRFESQFSFLIFKKHCKYHDLLLTVIRRRLKKREKHSRGKPSGGLFNGSKSQHPEASTPYHLEAQDRAMQNRPGPLQIVEIDGRNLSFT